MHFDLPKPLHGWRKITGEILIIVVSVLIRPARCRGVGAPTGHFERRVRLAASAHWTSIAFGSSTRMCNDYGNAVAYAEYAEALRQLSMPIRAPVAPPNLEPRSDIWPTELAPIFRRCEDGVELAQLRWGFPPSLAKGRAVINFRSEGRSFAKSRRCIVPASHFFEFQGTNSPKEKYRFTLNGEPWFCFAGLWRPASEDDPESFTLLSTTPGPDVAPIHSRQMVVLARNRWKAWLDLTAPEAEILAPLAPGSLAVERVR